jgi:AraC family transcriptional activator of pobA
MDFELQHLDFSLGARHTESGRAPLKRVMQPQHIVPSFFLYGEPPREVADHFLHIEALDDRSRPNNWNIRPHAHAALNHIFYLTSGGGVIRAESLTTRFCTPCAISIPARIIHAFEFDEDTSGTVFTLSETFLREQLVRHAEFAELFSAPCLLEFPDTNRDATSLRSSLERLTWELAWRAPGHAAAVESQLQAILVALLRLDHRGRDEVQRAQSREAELLARFRQLLETAFHSNKPIAHYARALGISPSRLRAACIEVTHRSPIKLLQDRLLLEAKRVLLYSNMSIAEAGYHLGFGDPAYFTRFFTKCTGMSPRKFRRQT